MTDHTTKQINVQPSLIFEKIPQIMSELDAIGKTKTNTQQGFKYRGIDDFYNVINPLFAKHGIFTVPNVLTQKREERTTKTGGTLVYSILEVMYSFIARDGSAVSAKVIGEGMDSGDKASNKAMAVAHKYALMQVFCVPTEDLVDPDSESHELATPQNKVYERTVTASKPVIQVSPQHVSNNPGSYQVTFGKFKGKTLTEIGIEQATSYAEYLSRSDKPSQQSTALIEAVDNWARSLATKTESNHSLGDAPPDWVTEDVPL